MQAVRILSLLVALSGVTVPEGIAFEQPVRCQETLNIQQTYAWDLDDGIVAQTGEPLDAPYDIQYAATLTPMNTISRSLVPKNGATLAVVGASTVGYLGCRSANLSNRPLNLGKLPKGTHLCARTNEGRYSEFSIVDLYPPYPASDVLTLVITYTTWER